MPAETALAQSIVLPPPTASIKSRLFSFIILIPSLTLDMSGLGFTPESSLKNMPLSFKSETTLSYSLVFFILFFHIKIKQPHIYVAALK